MTNLHSKLSLRHRSTTLFAVTSVYPLLMLMDVNGMLGHASQHGNDEAFEKACRDQYIKESEEYSQATAIRSG